MKTIRIDELSESDFNDRTNRTSLFSQEENKSLKVLRDEVNLQRVMIRLEK